ncbi:MAG: glycosyltransferase family A protein [Deltaproteobacteria bacterium]|nr:glycosyltransferase family A protein [Deltaproteobacteria bacterium]
MEGVSVIISYHNESATLEKTLDLLAAQTFPPKEILFVNSSSTDDSFLVIQKWIDRNLAIHKPTVRNIDEGTNVPGSSMNVGIRNASCKLLAFMDCNLYFDCYWLARQMTYMTTNNSDVVSGLCHFSGTSLQDKSAIAQTYGYYKTRPTVPSSLVRKVVFEKTGLFLENKRAGHDVDWIRKLKRDNIRREINEDVVIKYMGTNYAKSLRDIFLKTIRYSESTVNLYGYYNHHIYGIFLLPELVA